MIQTLAGALAERGYDTLTAVQEAVTKAELQEADLLVSAQTGSGKTMVIHAELPSNAEGLLHRSGRTGRAGRKGTSVLIVPPKIVKKAERLLSSARVQAEWTRAPSAEEILRRDEERLLADPAWAEEITDEQDAFAAKLLARHTPEQIASAYLRLYRSRQSAPEELVSPDARPVQKIRRSFEPGAWFALSVGRKDRAEPRWLLPLICRAGDVDKDAIGAIRVQQTETFVEVSAESAPRFLAALGRKAEIEKDIKIRQLDGPPDLSTRGSARPTAGSVETTPGTIASPEPEATPAATRKSEFERRPAPRGARASPPEVPFSENRDRPAATPRKPRHGSSAEGAKPKQVRTKPAQTGGRADGASSTRIGGKPAGASTGKDRATSSERRDTGELAKRPAAGKPAATPYNASDTSKRFTPPGKANVRTTGSPKARGLKGRPSNDGGGPPRRGKR